MKAKLKLYVLFIIVLTALAPAHAQSTAFTYHGRLNNNGAPVTGAYDLRFTIFDSSGGATVVAGPLPVNDLGVTNGLFTTRLDFGAGVFTGPNRWLEIEVRPAGNGNFETLSPRQELTSSPYAIRALSAGTATDVSSGSVVKSLNTLKDNVTLAAGANVTLTPSGNTLTIASSGGGGPWLLSGSSTYYNGGNVGVGTITPLSALHIFGAADAVRLTGNHPFLTLDDTAAGLYSRIQADGAGMNFKTQGAVTGSNPSGLLHLDGVGNVGIGTTAPFTRLSVAGAGAYNDPLAAAITLDNTTPTTGHRWEWHALDDGRMQLADVTAGATRMVINNAGNVGIGTDTPTYKLTIQSSGFGLEHTDGAIRLGTYVSADGLSTDGGWLGTISNHKLHFYVNNGLPSMTVNTFGDFGIGTVTPTAKLDVRGALTLESGGDAALYTGTGVSELNRYLAILNSPNLQSASGLKAGGILVSDAYGYANPGKNNLIVKGNVGIGTPAPGHKLHIAGEGASGFSIGIEGNATQNRDKGGWAKAMIYVNASGTIVRCFNGLGASTGNCGFTVNHDGPGDYNVLFGFQVTDRFAALTVEGYTGTFHYGPNVNGINVFTATLDNTPVDSAFTLIVY